MNKSNLILASVCAIIFTSVLIIFSPKTQKPSLPVPTPSPILTDSISPTPDPTADWKTYENKEYGFSFKYPKNIILEETNNFVNIPNKWGLTLQINKKVYLLIDEHNRSPYFNEAVKSKLTFGNNDFYYFNEPGMLDGSYIYDLDQKIEVIASEKDQHLTDNTFNQILSTFEFTSPDYLLEDGSTYKVIDNPLSWDNCGSEDNEISLNIKQKISALTQVSEKEINGLKIISTITLGFTPADIKQFYICQAGAFSPLKVLTSRILWISSCGTGAYWDGVEKCDETRTTIEKLYKL